MAQSNVAAASQGTHPSPSSFVPSPEDEDIITKTVQLTFVNTGASLGANAVMPISIELTQIPGVATWAGRKKYIRIIGDSIPWKLIPTDAAAGRSIRYVFAMCDGETTVRAHTFNNYLAALNKPITGACVPRAILPPVPTLPPVAGPNQGAAGVAVQMQPILGSLLGAFAACIPVPVPPEQSGTMSSSNIGTIPYVKHVIAGNLIPRIMGCLQFHGERDVVGGAALRAILEISITLQRSGEP